jgi:sirohydrochlorin cobaltochelatase
METVARRIASEHPERPVVCAYLELCTPSLAEAAAHLVDKGAAHITIVPMFLGTGKHAREDLPRLVESLRHSHPTISVEVQQAIGEDERMTALMAKIACEIPVRV